MPTESFPDTEIVRGSHENRTVGFDALYRSYADRLFGFSVALVKDQDLAVHATHESLTKAVAGIDKLRAPERLAPWLFAITRNESMSALHARHRWTDDEGVIEMAAVGTDVGRAAESAEAQRLVRDAMDALAPVDRGALALALRSDLDSGEVAMAMGTSQNQARAKISRARAALTSAVAAVVLTRREQGSCAGLDEALAGFDGSLTPLMRKRVSCHVKDCDQCSDRGRERALAYVSGFALPPAMLLPQDFQAKAAASVLSMDTSGVVPDLGPVDASGFPLGVDPLAPVVG